jgi:hypothetical protein
MAEDGRESGQRLHIADQRIGSEQRSDDVSKCIGGEQDSDDTSEANSGRAFEHVEKKGRSAQALAASTEDIGRANITAAGSAYVLMAKKPDQHVPNGDGAKQIGNGEDDQACKQHVESEFTICGGTYAACTTSSHSTVQPQATNSVAAFRQPATPGHAQLT